MMMNWELGAKVAMEVKIRWMIWSVEKTSIRNVVVNGTCREWLI